MPEQKPSTLEQLNALKKISYGQEDFERAVKSIITNNENSSTVYNILSEGIKDDPYNACVNFYDAIRTLASKSELINSPGKVEQLSHMARVVIIESLKNNGYTLKVEANTYALAPNTEKGKKQLPDLLRNIGIADASEAKNVLTTIKELEKEYIEKRTPRIAPVKQESQVKRDLLALQINTGSPQTAAERLRSTPERPSLWGSIFGDSMISRAADENAVPLIGLAAAIGLAKMFGFFNLFSGDKEADDHGGDKKAHGGKPEKAEGKPEKAEAKDTKKDKKKSEPDADEEAPHTTDTEHPPASTTDVPATDTEHPPTRPAVLPTPPVVPPVVPPVLPTPPVVPPVAPPVLPPAPGTP